MLNAKNEFYESKWFYVAQGILGVVWIVMVFWVLSENHIDQHPKIFIAFLGCWGICSVLFALKNFLACSRPYIVVDALRIKFAEKNRLPFFWFGQEQTILWNEIVSIACVPPYVELGPIKLCTALRMGKEKIPALRLTLRSGQNKWILLHALSEKTRCLLFEVVQQYKPIQNETSTG